MTGHDPDSLWTGQKLVCVETKCLLGIACPKQGKFIQKNLLDAVQEPLMHNSQDSKGEGYDLFTLRAPQGLIKAGSRSSER